MSMLVARCPQCATAFRVVADQLRVRGGLVRCGVCQTVFDGRTSTMPASASVADMQAKSPAQAEPSVVAATRLPPATADASVVAGPARRGEPAETPEVFIETSRPSPTVSGEQRRSAHVPPLRRRGAHVVSQVRTEPLFGGGADDAVIVGGEPEQDFLDDPSASGLTEPRPALFHSPVPAGSANSDFSAARPDAPLPPVLARRAHGGGVARVVWRTGFLLALLGLLFQTAWWWRTPLATHAPALRPALESMCEALGCVVGYVRAPRLLSIESSSVQPAALGDPDGRTERLVLQAVLRNRAGHPQPWPTLELSLTDYADTVIVRRVIPPAGYLVGDVAGQPFSAGSEQSIAVALTAQGVPVSGYRLSLFFP